MGMFDWITCKYPLPDPEMTGREDFQTKDFDCRLWRYTITEDGRLTHHYHEMEDTPQAEKPCPNARRGSWESLSGCVRLKAGSERDIEVPHHGDMYFYTNRDPRTARSEWMEYRARFTNGRVESIERVPNREAA